MTNLILLHIVADYAPGDLAFSEMVTALAYHLGDADCFMQTSTVPNFDTIGAGFIVAQIGLAEERPQNMMLFANCAPRKDLPRARRDNAGERLVFARLKNGVPVLTVNAGYSLSFIKHALAKSEGQPELWSVQVENRGSQFRSRDRYPEVVGKMARGDFSFCGKRLSPEDIPAYPHGVAAYLDNFENIKTTWRVGDKELLALRPGMRLLLRINGVIREALFSDGSFNAKEGELVFAPGSSGYDRRFMEVFQRGGHAASLFGVLSSGMQVEFCPLENGF